jgi:hypothetical protein
MLTTADFFWWFVGLGVLIAGYLGWVTKKRFGWSFFFLSLFWGLLIGASLMFVFSLTYEICEVYYERCWRVKGYNFDRVLTLLLFPLYSATMLFMKFAKGSQEDQ